MIFHINFKNLIAEPILEVKKSFLSSFRGNKYCYQFRKSILISILIIDFHVSFVNSKNPSIHWFSKSILILLLKIIALHYFQKFIFISVLNFYSDFDTAWNHFFFFFCNTETKKKLINWNASQLVFFFPFKFRKIIIFKHISKEW